MEADNSFDDGIVRSFWAVELVPNKEYTTTVPIDLHITQAVIPASGSDKSSRSVVSIKFEEDEDDKSKEKAIAIASLRLDTHDSQSLDVVVDEGSTVTFTVTGKNPVHLSGYYVPDNSDDDNEGLYGDDGSDEEIDSDEIGSEDDMDELDDSADEEKINAALAQLKRKQGAQNGGSDAKKAKVEKAEAPQQPKQEKKGQQQQQQQKKADAPQQQKQQQQEKKPQQQQQQKSPNQTKVLPNGLQMITKVEGSGAEATKGRKVSVKYVGKLTKNGKVFDASTNKPFTFTLGAREVITGWDLGVAGMKVGEKRTLVIPSELAYGKEGAGRDIPPNSSLTFDVELVNVR